MQGIQPQSLTDEELLRYARLYGASTLPAPWIEELIRRLEKALDA